MIWLSVALAADPTPLPHQLSVRTLAEGVHVFNATPWSATSLVVAVSDDAVVWVDTPPTPIQTEVVLGWIRERYGAQRTIVAINSHHHLDATGGNQVLAAARVPIYGGATTPTEMADRAAGMIAQTAERFADDPFMSGQLAGLVPTPPDHPFPIEGTLTLAFGDETVELIYPGHAHSADNIVAWFPQRRILYGGCMIKGGPDLGYLGEADLQRWGDAMQRLIPLAPQIVIPGHGTRTDPGLLEHTAGLVRAGLAPDP